MELYSRKRNHSAYFNIEHVINDDIPSGGMDKFLAKVLIFIILWIYYNSTINN